MDTASLPSPFTSPQSLSARIGRADAPLLLDVRPEARFADSPWLIAGAVRCAADDVEALAAAGPAREVVVYCVYGHELSRQAAAVLKRHGWRASFLAGGFEGGEDGVDASEDIRAWRASGLPMIRKRSDLGVTGAKPSRWITRGRPKIDRIACPWLIRRFIDPRAVFLYVPASSVLDQAKRLNAVAFDVPGGAITHVGDRCSFDALLGTFAIQDAALQLLAHIVRGADTDRLDLAPQSAGLLAVSLGLSELHADSDAAMLEAALPIYDALHAWCRMQVAGSTEVHRWNPEGAAGGRA